MHIIPFFTDTNSTPDDDKAAMAVCVFQGRFAPDVFRQKASVKGLKSDRGLGKLDKWRECIYESDRNCETNR